MGCAGCRRFCFSSCLTRVALADVGWLHCITTRPMSAMGRKWTFEGGGGLSFPCAGRGLVAAVAPLCGTAKPLPSQECSAQTLIDRFLFIYRLSMKRPWVSKAARSPLAKRSAMSLSASGVLPSRHVPLRQPAAATSPRGEGQNPLVFRRPARMSRACGGASTRRWRRSPTASLPTCRVRERPSSRRCSTIGHNRTRKSPRSRCD